MSFTLCSLCVEIACFSKTRLFWRSWVSTLLTSGYQQPPYGRVRTSAALGGQKHKPHSAAPLHAEVNLGTLHSCAWAQTKPAGSVPSPPAALPSLPSALPRQGKAALMGEHGTLELVKGRGPLYGREGFLHYGVIPQGGGQPGGQLQLFRQPGGQPVLTSLLCALRVVVLLVVF